MIRSDMKCPRCKVSLQKNEMADITTDVCPKCHGVFLDRGELNMLATGMKGDVEYCSIDEEWHKDRFPVRRCPKCVDAEMRKVNLLRFSDLIFDYCESCGGFYLDKSEIPRMNRELESWTSSNEAEEYRGTSGEHLVRVDQRDEVFVIDIVGVRQPIPGSYICVRVFFAAEMPVGLRVSVEAWPLRLAQIFGLSWGQDIETGDTVFDSLFRVQGGDEAIVRAHLNERAREALVAFVEAKEPIFSRFGSLFITPKCVLYLEGPYIPGTTDHVVQKCQPCIGELARLAGLVQRMP